MAYAFINALSSKQQHLAIFKTKTFSNIVTVNKTDVNPLDIVGIKVKSLNSDQKLKLKAIINEYLSTLPNDIAKARENKINSEEFETINFGWAGSIKKGEPHYYRIQGKTFLIELDNTQNNANHIHCVWRDFDGDFGKDLIKEHYQHSKHHSHN